MVEVITGKDADAAWEKLEGWLARKRWTPDEAAALLAGHYPDSTIHPDSNILEFVPNGRPPAWRTKTSKELLTLTSELRRSLLAHLRLLSSPKRQLKSMPPTRWLELAILARRGPRWLSPGRKHPRLARYLPPAAQLQPKISSASNHPPTGLVSKKRRDSAFNENRSTMGPSVARAVPLDRGSIHEWTYLEPDAVERILAAPKLKLAVAEEDSRVLRLALRHITFILLHHSCGREPNSDEVRQVRQTYERLLDAVEVLGGLEYPAPLPPGEWHDSLLRWLATEENVLASRKKGGAPIKRWDRLAYPHLLGFYELAFARPAASTSDGPTMRFLETYLAEVNDSLAGSQFKVPNEKEQILRVWKVPNPRGLASKIRAAKSNAVARMHFDLLKAGREARKTADIAKTGGK